jgi:hypothetical protein
MENARAFDVGVLKARRILAAANRVIDLARECLTDSDRKQPRLSSGGAGL